MTSFRLSIALLLLVAALSGCSTPSTPTDAAGPDAPLQNDADGDGIGDYDEGYDGVLTRDDTDGDGIPDYLDLDADGDTLPDSVEAGDSLLATRPVDSDGDGTPDFRDLDSDDNGMPDVREGAGDADGDRIPDYADRDDDDDLVLDRDELAGRVEFPRDVDDDGIPDFRDPDSDNDTILDGSEWHPDTDGDGLPDPEDIDSDNDGYPDAEEAGDGDLRTAPVDTDGDGVADFRDPDSDNDGLSDISERAAGSSRVSDDTDDDGVSDLIEVGAGTDPLDASDNPRVRGDFVFVVPFDRPPTPSRDTLNFRTNVQLADVYFLFDLTGSMSAEINVVRTATIDILDELTCEDSGMSCRDVGDCEFVEGSICGPMGTCIEDPETTFCVASLFTGVGTYEGEASSYTNLLSLQSIPMLTRDRIPTTANGSGGSESLFQSVACTVNPSLCAAVGCGVGGVGCPSYRNEAVRMLVTITDEDNQCDTVPSCAPASALEVGAILRGSAVTFAGINAGTSAPATADLTSLAEASESRASDGSPLVFLAGDAGTPEGATRLVDSVVAAVNEVVRNRPLRITIDPADVPGDAGDALQFIERLEVNITRPGCLLVEDTSDVNPRDGFADTFDAVQPGNRVCWDILVRRNAFVEPTREPQVFRAELTVRGDGSPLDRRTVYFLVPPDVTIIDVPE